MIETKSDVISLADEEEVKQVLVNSVLGLWDVVNNLTRLKPSRRDRYRVTIFGSARAKAGTFGYEETKRAAAALAEMGCDIITGDPRRKDVAGPYRVGAQFHACNRPSFGQCRGHDHSALRGECR